MRNLIYYPTFEPTNTTWLKYALLHIEQFSPIIPVDNHSNISPIFNKIKENTDLVLIQAPGWKQGADASTKALREIDFIRRFPELYRDSLGHSNIVHIWQNPVNWTYKLHDGKYNIPFKYECIRQDLGEECDGGLIVSKELAQFYMAFLAEEIAFEKQGDPITDIEDLYNLSTYLRTRNPKNERLLNAAKTVVNISLPTQLENISIDTLIRFRNDSGISELRHSFNKSLDLFYNSIESDFDGNEFIKGLQSTNKELIKETILYFGGVTAAALGGMILLENPNKLEIIKQAVEGTILTIGGIASVSKAWNEDSEKRNSRRFISHIKQLVR